MNKSKYFWDWLEQEMANINKAYKQRVLENFWKMLVQAKNKRKGRISVRQSYNGMFYFYESNSIKRVDEFFFFFIRTKDRYFFFFTYERPFEYLKK